MGWKKEVVDLAVALWKHMQGKESNLIPLSGLTLEVEHRKFAQSALKQPEDSLSDPGVIGAFERALATYIGLDDAVSFSSGRASVSVLLEAMKVKKEDAVLVCGFNCVAVANALFFIGAKPVFYDIEWDTYGGDFEDIQRKFARHSGIVGIIVQHSFGMIGRDTRKIVAWAREQGLWTIEDACHSLGAKKENTPAGSFGDAVFFSMERSKCISTFQGGVASSQRADILEFLKKRQSITPFPSTDRCHHLLRQFIFTYDLQRDNRRWYLRPWVLYQHRGTYIPGITEEEALHSMPDGYIQRLCAPLAEIGRKQLKHLDHWNEVRREKAREWAFWAESRQLPKPRPDTFDEPIFLRYPVLVEAKNKKNTQWGKELGIEVGTWFESHLHPVEYRVENCPQAEVAIQRCVNLPTNLAYKC